MKIIDNRKERIEIQEWNAIINSKHISRRAKGRYKKW